MIRRPLHESDKQYLKEQKQKSRNDEAAVANAMLDILVRDFNVEMRYVRTKSAQKTVKMLVPHQLTFKDETPPRTLTTDEIRAVVPSDTPPYPVNAHETEKQRKRTLEARMSNGLLALLEQRNFRFLRKRTRPSTKTTQLIRVISVTTPQNVVLQKQQLIERGTAFVTQVTLCLKNRREVVINRDLLTALHEQAVDQQCQDIIRTRFAASPEEPPQLASPWNGPARHPPRPGDTPQLPPPTSRALLPGTPECDSARAVRQSIPSSAFSLVRSPLRNSTTEVSAFSAMEVSQTTCTVDPQPASACDATPRLATEIVDQTCDLETNSDDKTEEIEVKVEERPPRQATDIRCHPSLAMTSGFL